MDKLQPPWLNIHWINSNKLTGSHWGVFGKTVGSLWTVEAHGFTVGYLWTNTGEPVCLWGVYMDKNLVLQRF